MPYGDSPERLSQNSKELEKTFPAYQAEISNLQSQQKEQLSQWTQKYDIIRYLLSGKPFKYDLDGDGIPETIKWGIPFDQIIKLAQELSQADEQKQKELIQQSLKAYVELQDLKEDLFLNLQSKEILKYLQGTSLFNIFVDYFEKQWANQQEAIEQTENLSKAINSIWELYLQRALPPEFDQQNLKALATGFSFGFMKWLVNNPQNIEEVSNYIAKLSSQDATELVQSGLKGLMWSKNVIGFLQSSTALVKQLAQNKDTIKPKNNKALKDPSIWADIVAQFLQDPQNYDPINEVKKYICQQPLSQDCLKIDESHLRDIANETAKLLEQNPSMLKSMDYLANLAPVLKQVDEGIQQFKTNMLTNPVWWALINWLSDLQQMLGSLNKEWGEKLKWFLDNIMFWLGFRWGIESFWIEKARALQLSLKPSLITFLNQNKENLKWTLFEKDTWNNVKGVQGNLSEGSLDFFKNLKTSIPTTPKQQIDLIKQLFNANEKKGQLTKLINQVLAIDEFKQRFDRHQFLLKLQNGKAVLDLNDLDKLLQAYIDFEKQKDKHWGIKKFDEFLLQMQTQYFVFGATTASTQPVLTPWEANQEGNDERWEPVSQNKSWEDTTIQKERNIETNENQKLWDAFIKLVWHAIPLTDNYHITSGAGEIYTSFPKQCTRRVDYYLDQRFGIKNWRTPNKYAFKWGSKEAPINKDKIEVIESIQKPQPWDIIVFNPNQDNYGEYGHVAIIEAVNPSKSEEVIISEMNMENAWGGPGIVNFRKINLDEEPVARILRPKTNPKLTHPLTNEIPELASLYTQTPSDSSGQS